MTTLAELVDTAPSATRGSVKPGITWDDGEWRLVYELADPSAGSDVEWYDITEFVEGYEYTRGADQPFGRYRASVANIAVHTNDDTLAPWNPDTSPTFGTHVELGPGLLIRCSLIRVVAAAVVEWNPRFTLKVERWGDASYAKGTYRLHRIVARDTMTSLVGVPIPESVEENWSERFEFIVTQANWQYGTLVYGATFLPGPTDVLTLPARDAATSAVQELDATLDPAGLVWYTNRKGQLVVRPSRIDTFHETMFGDGAAGDTVGTTTPVTFSHLAEDDPTGDHTAYALNSEEADSFGIERSEEAIVNHVIRTDPVTAGFDGDDPVSIERFDRKTSSQAWIVANDQVAQDLLDAGAWREWEARPVYTTIDHHGFMPGAGIHLDYLLTTGVDYQSAPGRLFANAGGVCRQYVEHMRPRRGGEDEPTEWDVTVIIDVFANQLEVEAQLNPVEDLALEDVSQVAAEFSWTNPSQTITPTHTQVRMLNPASLWATVPYPITGIIWGGLDPATLYEFQVRLIRVVAGVTTHFSASSTYEFVTDAATIPVVDIDEDGDGEVTFPEPPCGSLDWELQESDDGVSWSMVDDGTISSPPWTIDLSGYTFDPTKLYRVWQDACGDESYSDVFTGACTDPPALADPPFDDAALVAYWPGICPPDIVNEAISESPALHGPNFGLFVLDGDLNVVLVSEGEGVIVYGGTPGTPVAGDSDITIACKVLITTQPDAPIALFGYEGISLEAVAEGSNWAVQSRIAEDGAGITTVTDGEELDFGTWIDLAVTHDVAGGNIRVYVDAVEAVTALGTVGARFGGGVFQIGGPDGTLITNCAVWDRVLDPTELPGYTAPTPTLPAAIMALSPIGYWKLNETGGTTATDSSGNGRNGTYTGSGYTLAGATGVPAGMGQFVDLGNGGNSSHIAIADNNAWTITTAGLTWFMLVKPDSVAGSTVEYLITKGTTSNYEWSVAGNAGVATRIVAQIWTLAGNNFMASSADILTTGWQALCVSTRVNGVINVNDDIHQFRNNNTNVATNTGPYSPGGSPANGTSEVRIGWRGDSPANTYLKGSIAHVAVFADELTTTEINTLMGAAHADGWF